MTASRSARLKIFMSRWHLDREIAAGRDCNATDELALRARQLGELRGRCKIARALRDVVDYVDHTGSRALISPCIARPMAARFGRAAILELADQLETPQAVNPRGVALANTLVNDGLSPLFDPNAERTVTEAAREATAALAAGRAAHAPSQTAVPTSTATNST